MIYWRQVVWLDGTNGIKFSSPTAADRRRAIKTLKILAKRWTRFMASTTHRIWFFKQWETEK